MSRPTQTLQSIPNRERTATDRANGDDLLTEVEAAKFLGISQWQIQMMRRYRILNPEQGTFLHRRSSLFKVKPCLEAAWQLSKNGWAEAVAGHLWILQKVDQLRRSDPPFKIVDLGSKRGRIYTPEKASEEYGFRRVRLLRELKPIGIFGSQGSSERFVLFDDDLEEYTSTAKPVTYRKDFTDETVGELYVDGLSDKKSNDGRRLWDCTCSCGNPVVLSTEALKTTRSCGHLRKHGFAKHKMREHAEKRRLKDDGRFFL